MDAVDQLDQAVTLALQGSNDLKGQALQFVAQVEADPASWLGPSLEIVTTGAKSDTTQFFALQIIDRVVVSTPEPATLELARSKLWSRVAGLAQNGGNCPKHLRNKLAEALKSLFVRLYADGWASFFGDMLQLVSQNAEFGGELYAQVLLAIHHEIGDQLFARDPAEQARANALKDMVRDRDARVLAESWVRILGASDTTAPSVVDGIIQVVAGWVVWTDVGLILPAVPYIEKQLGHRATRHSAASALVEILSKKMVTPDLKLELLQTTQIVAALRACAPDTPEFGECLARVVNAVLFEAAHALLELPVSDGGAVAQGLHALVAEVFPLVVQYFEDEYDDTTVQLVPGVTEFLTFLRRESRRTNDKASTIVGGNLAEPQRQYLRSLLASLVKKSRYDAEDYELGELNDEDLADAEFGEFRAKLRVLQEQLAQIDTMLYLEVVGNFVNEVLGAKGGGAGSGTPPTAGAMGVGASEAASDWTALELALYELSVYNDVARLFVTKGSKYGSGLGDLAGKAQQTQFMLFGQMVMAPAAGWPSWTHPANLLWYMQLVQRHAATFLAGKSDEHLGLLTQALNFFLKSGIQNSLLKVRVQSWYMFYRLVKAVKRAPLLADPAVGPMIFEALAAYLPVQVAAPPPTEDLVLAAQEDTVFNSQLYLYELCGILFVLGDDRARSADLMRQLLATMFTNIDRATTAGSAGPVHYLTVHHNIVALSSLTKGISDTVSESTTPRQSLDELSAQLKTATQMVVAVLENSHGVRIIRDACRQAFSRMLGLLEDKIIMEISSFIDVSLQTSSPADMGDFLSFLGQLAHQFATNGQMFEMFTSLCVPLFEKVFGTLQQVAQTADVEAEGSTDAQIFRREVVASYLQLLINILNNNYGAMLFRDNNAAVFESIYSSLLHYATNGDVKGGAGSASNQKLAVTLLTKMVTMWGPTGKVAAPNFAADMPVPLFSDEATYERLTELCWSLPATQGFNIQDAQSRMVLAELAGLQKAMFDTRGHAYQAYLVQYLTGSGLEPGALQEFANSVNLPLKDFKRQFVEFLQKALNK